MKGRETMEQYQVTGMSCAACSARVEKAVSSVEGVTSCSVSLLTNSMGVEGTADSSAIIKAVEDAGYGAKKKGVQTQSNSADADLLKDRETPVLKKRLITSLCFLIPLMYLSMGHMMWNWPIPKILDGNHVAMGLIQLLFTTIIMVINQKFFISGFKSLFHKAPNMDTLVALGSAASYGYSVYILFAMTDAQMHQNMDAVMKYMHEFYFESAAMILTLITVGKMLEARSKGKTTDALKSLMKLSPKSAIIERDGKEQELKIKPTEEKYNYTGIAVNTSNDKLTEIAALYPNSPGEKQGLQAKDIIIAINDNPVENNAQKLVDYINLSIGKEIKFTVERNGENVNITIMPDVMSNYLLGVNLKMAENNFINNIYYAFFDTGEFAISIVDNLRLLFSGGVSIDQLMGPVGISDVRCISESQCKQPQASHVHVQLSGYYYYHFLH